MRSEPQNMVLVLDVITSKLARLMDKKFRLSTLQQGCWKLATDLLSSSQSKRCECVLISTWLQGNRRYTSPLVLTCTFWLFIANLWIQIKFTFCVRILNRLTTSSTVQKCSTCSEEWFWLARLNYIWPINNKDTSFFGNKIVQLGMSFREGPTWPLKLTFRKGVCKSVCKKRKKVWLIFETNFSLN